MIYEEPGLFPNQESSQEDSLAKTYPSLANVLDLPENAVVCFGKSVGSLTISTPDGSSSKTSPVCCRQTEDEIWEPSSGRWQTSGMGSATEFWTLSTSESPSVAVECSLSDVLETTGEHLRKYLLSAKACEGILRRATRRERKLPERLEAALQAVK
jgi:hypothetical protein